MPRARSFEGAMGALYASTPISLRDLVQQTGGTREAAQVLGVTQRTVQRYITTAGERRGQGASQLSQRVRERATRAVRAAAAHRQLRRDGLRVSHVRASHVKFSKEKARGRVLTYDVDIPGAALGRMVAALELGDWELAQQEFVDAYCDAFAGTAGEIDGIDLLDMDYGQDATPTVPFVEMFPPRAGGRRAS